MESRSVWRWLAAPGVLWLTVFFLIAFYAVLAVAFGNTNTFNEVVPFWSPTQWNVGYMLEVLDNIWSGGQFLTVFLRTLAYVGIALAISLLIGYPVAYYTARHAGRWKWLLLLALILPFWINYLMRMFAWINLLSPDGWATQALHYLSIDQLFINLGLLTSEGGWLEGQPSTVVIALVYGYIPFLIIPLFAALDRIDQRHIEAARDLGASPFSAFRRVTLPLSMPGIVSGSLIVFAWTLSAFPTPELLGGGKVKMIANVVKDLGLDSFNWPGAAAFAMLALALTLALLMVVGRVSSGRPT
jgi:spermidine/putrescine transport system permease protein